VKENDLPMLKKSLLLVLLSGILAGGYYYWYLRPGKENGKTPHYRMTQVTRGPLVQTVATDGRTEPNFVVEVKSKASGEILRLVYEEGDRVSKGDLLVELDPADETRQVRKMKISLIAAQAKLAKAQSELATARQTIPATIAEAEARVASTNVALTDARNKLQRAQGLDRRKIISEEVLENAQTAQQKAVAEHRQALASLAKAKAERSTLAERQHDIDLARTQVTDAEIALEEAQERLADTRIVAPIDGVIIRQLVEQGQIISSGISNVGGGTALLLLADLSRVFVIASVDETDIGRIQLGQMARLTADAYQHRAFQGKVVHIAPQGVVESNVTTFSVKIEVEGDGKRLLKPAMSVNVEIITQQRENTLMVVSTAIQESRGADRATLYQLKNGQPVAVPVQIGFSDGMHTEIRQGAEAGLEVIANVASLRNNATSRNSGSPNSQERARNMRRFIRRLQR
jgi:HlyD family secretion protein